MPLTRSKLILLLLMASLALNLFLVGVVSVRSLHQPERPPAPPAMGWMVRDMDSGTRQVLAPQLESFAESLRPLRGDMFRAQREVNQLMASEPLDQEALLAAFAQLRQANLRYQELSHEQLVLLSAQLDVEQRQQSLRFMNGRRNPAEGRPELRNRQ
jgi:uncharacterized membrane protein